ncbi:hypothetical protein APHAL10511_005339 [Amanita phalloides]|nr:hypothetical protein APHAL10511_005339 [Amanita phalloides]
MSAPNTSGAERLKAEGNALFVNNDFSGAYKKYSEAIKHDGNNAVLYCNRAACSYGLKRYLDSSTDAKKATKLNPGYAKAWARLAAAHMNLNAVEKAVEDWKRAIATLPVENLTAAEVKQKSNYASELAAAQAKVTELKASPGLPKNAVHMNASAQLPWHRAKAMIPELEAQNKWLTSAWVIAKAYDDWDESVRLMKLGRHIHTPAGTGYLGQRGVIMTLSNALVSDPRVFHIADNNFFEKYNQQIIFEATHSKAWVDSGSKDVMIQAPKRLQSQGWDSVRPAIQVTVRGWIMRAFLEDYLRESVEVALEFYTAALEILQWGNEFWKDVPYEKKGNTFQPTFVRGVKCLRLDTFIKAYKQNPGENSKFSLEALLADANQLLEELKGLENPLPEMQDPAFYLSFFRYPMAQAHALRGFYYHHKGQILREKTGITDEVADMYSTGAMEYLAAATLYPDDEQKRAWFLHTAFNMQLSIGGPVDFFLRVLNLLHEAIPRIKEIWEFSADSFEYGEDMEFRQQLLDAVENGTVQDPQHVWVTADMFAQ